MTASSKNCWQDKWEPEDKKLGPLLRPYYYIYLQLF